MSSLKKRKYTKRSTDRKQNKKIAKLSKQVKTLIKADEKKLYDDYLASSSLAVSGHVQPMLDIPFWVTNVANSNNKKLFAREGDTINVTSMVIKGMVQIDSSSATLADLSNIVRIVVVRMTDDNPAAPTMSDIFKIGGAVADYTNSFYSVGGTRRYQKLYDKKFLLENPTQSCTSSAGYFACMSEPWRKRFVINVPLPKSGLKVEYQANAITGANPVTNGIYMLACSDSGNASVVHPKWRFDSRTRFLDA